MQFHIHPAIDMLTVAALTLQAEALPPHQPSFWEGPTGFLIGGIGFAVYWVVKAVMDAKFRPVQAQSEAALPALWTKIQEVLDAQRVNQEVTNKTLADLNDTLKNMHTSVTAHDTYVREHVGQRGPEMARELGGSIAPLVVNAIRGAFEDERMQKVAARHTDPIGKPRVRRRK